jgi:uncharacterized protein
VPSTIVDTGPLVAFVDKRDHHHAAAVRWLKRARKPLVTNVAVLTEVTHLLDFSVDAQAEFLDWTGAVLEIDTGTSADLARITAIMRRYRDRPADFADASLVALAERIKTDLIASIDRDFDVYRMANNKPFRNTFAK